MTATEHQVVVVFDVTADNRLDAARAVLGVINGTRGWLNLRDGSPAASTLESWWFPEAELKALDGNDNGAMHLEPDDPPHDLFVEDDADDEPTVWLHDYAEPDRPLPLLRRLDVASVWPGTPKDRSHKAYDAGDELWKHIVRDLPTSAPVSS